MRSFFQMVPNISTRHEMAHRYSQKTDGLPYFGGHLGFLDQEAWNSNQEPFLGHFMSS